MRLGILGKTNCKNVLQYESCWLSFDYFSFVKLRQWRRTNVPYVKWEWECRNMENMPILVRGVVSNSLWWGAVEELLWLRWMLPNTGLVEILFLITYFPSPSLLLLPPLQHCPMFSFHGWGRVYGGSTSW